MRLIWAEEAECDLYKIADQAAALEPGLDDVLLERVYEALLILLRHPRLGEAIGGLDLRKWTVKNTPFVLLYRVAADRVEVVRVVAAMNDWRTT